jgi:hypothetical protein
MAKAAKKAAKQSRKPAGRKSREVEVRATKSAGRKVNGVEVRAAKPAGRKAREVEVRATRASGAKKQATKKAAKGGRATRSSATTVMGMRVPEGVSSALDSLVNSPRGRKLLASALVAAAGAAAAALANAGDDDDRDDGDVERSSNESGDPLKTATKDLSLAAAGALAEMATGAVQSLLPTSLGGSKGKGS